MLRVTITRAETKTSAPDATNQWKKLGIQTNVHGDKWLGCFYPGERYPNKTLEATLAGIKPGDTLDIVVTPSDDGKFLNFKIPSKQDILEARVEVIEKHLGIGAKQDEIPF